MKTWHWVVIVIVVLLIIGMIVYFVNQSNQQSGSNGLVNIPAPPITNQTTGIASIINSLFPFFQSVYGQNQNQGGNQSPPTYGCSLYNPQTMQTIVGVVDENGNCVPV